MSLNPTVERRLRLALGLLSEPACDPCRDLVLSHVAADLALTAIAQQLGHAATGLESAMAELSPATPEDINQHFKYLRTISRASAQLRASGSIPDSGWDEVKQHTLNAITASIAEYLQIEPAAFLPQHPVQPSAPPGERRSRPRYPCEGSAEVRVPYAGPPAKGTILDVSGEGCCIESDFPFDVGRRVELMLKVNKLTFRAMGIVANSGKRNGAGRHRLGIRFLALSSGGKQRLQELIAELGQGPEATESTAVVP